MIKEMDTPWYQTPAFREGMTLGSFFGAAVGTYLVLAPRFNRIVEKSLDNIDLQPETTDRDHTLK